MSDADAVAIADPNPPADERTAPGTHEQQNRTESVKTYARLAHDGWGT